MKIKSNFALLDVTSGRAALNKQCDKRNNLREAVPVVIRGYITHRHGSFDGTSQEFAVDVTSVEVFPRTQGES
jgi:hypothetical protein